MVVIPRSSTTAKPCVTQIASEELGGLNPQASIAVRKSTDNGDGSWGPWEYVNPPLQLGTEYRTTERYLGKPVYVKVVNCGNLPGNAAKITDFEQVNVIDEVVSVTGHCTDGGGVRFTLPAHFGSAPNWDTVVLIDAASTGSIQITSFTTAAAVYTDTYITVKYTKLAD